MEEIRIRPLNLDIIAPNLSNCKDPDQGGSKLVIIGKPGTGKTTLIRSLLYEKSALFPVGLVMSGTEESTGFFGKFMPPVFVFNNLEIRTLEEFITRQKVARKHLANPWAVLLIDDCADDPKLLSTPLFQRLYKNGRHFKMLFILSLQYSMDVKPVIRAAIDGTFILRETNLRERRKLWENYGGIVPDFSTFNTIMNTICDDYTALYIHNQHQSNRLEDNLFWYRAKPVPKSFRFGSPEYWKFNKSRYDEQSQEDLL